MTQTAPPRSAGPGVGPGLGGSAPVPGRLPLPRRRTALRASAIAALVAVCAVAGAVLVRSAGHRSAVLVVAQTVPAGTRITDADLGTARAAADPGLDLIAAGDRSQFVGQYAAVGLRPGTTLARDEVTTDPLPGPGQVLVAVALKPGQLPIQGLAAGDSVEVVSTPGDGSGAVGATDAGPGTLTGPVRGLVRDVAAAGQATGQTVLDLVVPAAVAVPLAQAASTGKVAVLQLPAGS